jgi:hypothetical protein
MKAKEHQRNAKEHQQNAVTARIWDSEDIIPATKLRTAANSPGRPVGKPDAPARAPSRATESAACSCSLAQLKEGGPK